MQFPNRNIIVFLSTGFICGFLGLYSLQNSLILQSNLFEKFCLLENSPPKSDNNDTLITDNHEEADELFKKVNIFCYVMTYKANHEKKAKHVKATWAKRCNKVLFFSTAEDKFLKPVVIKLPDNGRNHLWEKTRKALTYIYKNHLNDSDWFYKSDDDTYAVLENLRYMLRVYDPKELVQFGLRLKYGGADYMTGGPGYVLSRASVKKFVEEALPDGKKCPFLHSQGDDVYLGTCLKNIGVKSIDSRDHLGRHRFLQTSLESHVFPSPNFDKLTLKRLKYYPAYPGKNCCSDTFVAFHYVPPPKMYELEYLLYQLRPVGIKFNAPSPPPFPPDTADISKKTLENFGKGNTTIS